MKPQWLTLIPLFSNSCCTLSFVLYVYQFNGFPSIYHVPTAILNKSFKLTFKFDSPGHLFWRRFSSERNFNWSKKIVRHTSFQEPYTFYDYDFDLRFGKRLNFSDRLSMKVKTAESQLGDKNLPETFCSGTTLFLMHY